MDEAASSVLLSYLWPHEHVMGEVNLLIRRFLAIRIVHLHLLLLHHDSVLTSGILIKISNITVRLLIVRRCCSMIRLCAEQATIKIDRLGETFARACINDLIGSRLL